MILTARCSIPTARNLSHAIRELHPSRKVRLMYTARPDKIVRLHIRYGNTLQVSCQETDYNSPGAISFLRDKFRFTNFLSEAGFITPEFINFRLPNKEEYPVLIRKTLTGFKGYGIVICKNEKDYETHWRNNAGYYWCSYLDNSSEFRVHVVNPKKADPRIIRVMKKVAKNQEIESLKVKVRHLDNYFYSRRFDFTKKYPKLVKEVLKMAELLPGRFYTLDMAWSRKFSRPICFEANTASGLDTVGAAQYAEFFIAEGII